MKSTGQPIAAARAATLGVCAFESGAGALCAGGERFSIDSAHQGEGRWWSARCAPCCAWRTSRADHKQSWCGHAFNGNGTWRWYASVAMRRGAGMPSVANASRRRHAFKENNLAAATRDSVITNRKTSRKPQKAARAAGLRRAPPHHSSQARSGILNRKTPRMPPRPPARPRKGDHRKIFQSTPAQHKNASTVTHTRERHRSDARHRVSPKRPPARPFRTGPANLSPQP